jgi:hypothetical protein
LALLNAGRIVPGLLNAAIGVGLAWGQPRTISDTDNADLANDKIFLYECLDDNV